MDTEEPDDEFWDLADGFIDLANAHMDKVGADKVSSALLYAAARFNAFIVASQEDLDIENEKDGAVQFFSKQYRKVFTESLEDYEKNPS